MKEIDRQICRPPATMAQHLWIADTLRIEEVDLGILFERSWAYLNLYFFCNRYDLATWLFGSTVCVREA